MKLKQLASNMIELELNNRTQILFSYEIPVAGYTTLNGVSTYFKTTTKYSKTTSKHINKYLNGSNAVEVDQCLIDELMK